MCTAQSYLRTHYMKQMPTWEQLKSKMVTYSIYKMFDCRPIPANVRNSRELLSSILTPFQTPRNWWHEPAETSIVHY